MRLFIKEIQNGRIISTARLHSEYVAVRGPWQSLEIKGKAQSPATAAEPSGIDLK